MDINKIIEEENRLLRSELGSSPLWEWKHSSKLRFRVQKIVEDESAPGGIRPLFDYRANPATGLIELMPIYVDMPMLPMIPNSWLLARYVEANQEISFRAKFGTRVEYPVGGIWQPVSTTALRPGIIPSRKDTWNMIHAARANRVAVREHFENAEAEQDRRHAADRANFIDKCRDRFTVGLEIPGTKGSHSLFNAKPSDSVILKNQPISQEIN